MHILPAPRVNGLHGINELRGMKDDAWGIALLGIHAQLQGLQSALQQLLPAAFLAFSLADNCFGTTIWTTF